MKYFKHLFFVLLAGSCAGVFFYVRSFPVVIRFYIDTGGDSIFPWAFSSLPRLGVYILVANLILFAIWLLYSFVYSRLSGGNLKDILQLDAYTYLPLCVLAISLFQFNSPLTKGFVLLSQNAGYLLLLVVVIAVYYLKVQAYRKNTPLPPSTSLRTGPSRGEYSFQNPPLRGVGGCLPVSLTQAPTWKTKLLIFLISFAIYVVVGARVTDELGPGGDEPHYLLITHSLLYDHDLAIKNNYNQRDYQAFFSADLRPHLSIGKDGTRYPGHPIGLPVLLIPVYAFKGYQGAIVFMNFLAALLALQLYLLAFSITRNKRLSLLLWFVASFASPLLLYSSQIYPEIPSALLLAIAYHIIRSPKSPLEGGQEGVSSLKKKRLFQSLILGGSLALLPWIQQRMILPAIILTLYYIVSSKIIPWRKQWNKQQIPYIVIPVLLFALSGIVMAGFYYALYRNPMPNAPYASVGMPNVFSLDIFLKQGLLGLLFDQEGGLLIYSPYYFFIFAGFLLFIRYHFSRALWLFFLISSIYIPCGGFILQWRGAWSPASRYMVALVPFFFPLLCEAIRQARRNIHRYTFFFFVVISFYWSYLFFHTPFLAIMRGRGINNLLEQGSNNFVDPSRYFPSFSDTSSIGTYILTGMWILVILAFSVSMYRSTQKGITPPYPPQGGKNPPLTPPRRGITPPYPPQGGIATGLKNVGKFYALLLGLLLIFTFASEHIESNIIPLIANNKHLREFLFNFDHYARVSQQPIAHEELQFEYLSRRKRGVVEKRGSRFIVSGPYDPFPAGKYTAYFKILAADNSSQRVIATLDIVAIRGSRLFSKRDLRGVDFAAAGQYELMPLQFELREDVDDLEARVYFHNRVDIIVKKIYIKPDFSNFYYDAGMSAFWEGQYEKAKTIFSQTLSVSDHLRACYQIGVIEQFLGNWGRSSEMLQQVVDDEPDFADAHYRLGAAFQENNNLEKAREHFEQATSLLPTHLDAWKALQATYRQLDMNVEAENAEETINALYQPQNPYAVNFGNQVMFMGYSVRNPTPGKLAIDYYWKALSPMKRDYAFFVHFKHYGTKFQQDHAPQILDSLTGQHRYYSTSQWQVGELVHEKFEIDARAGTFDIHLGVWEPIYIKKRLPVISPSQRLFFKKKRIKLKRITVN